MKPKKRYSIRHYTDKRGRDCYPIYYKNGDLPWQRLATARHKEVAEQVVARLKAEDPPEHQPNLREQLLQNVLQNHPTLTREEADAVVSPIR